MAEPVGFYTDTTVCIGCKACEVACYQSKRSQPSSATFVL